MDYKKLVSLLAVSTLALAACDTDEEPTPDPDIEEGTEGADEVEEDTTVEDTDETEDTEDLEDVDETDDAEDTESSSGSAHDIIDGIGSDLSYTAPIELEVAGGTWSQAGYVFTPEEGEATVNGVATPNDEVEEVYAFVIEEGVVFEKPEVEEGEFSFTVNETEGDQEFQVGVSDEDLWEVGDEADVEELVRYENVIIMGPQGE
ncbi:MAG: hypothetical protein ABS873_02895 [Alkalibacterium sp.]